MILPCEPLTVAGEAIGAILLNTDQVVYWHWRGDSLIGILAFGYGVPVVFTGIEGRRVWVLLKEHALSGNPEQPPVVPRGKPKV